MRRVRLGVWAVVALITVGAVLSNAMVVVQPGERVVVRRLGRKQSRELTPGLHLSIPLGIDRLDRVRSNEVRRMRVGLSKLPSFDDEPGLGEYLSGDLNLVRVEFELLYRVDDAARFSLASSDPIVLLGQVADAALARSLSRSKIDSALGSDRSRIGLELANHLRAEPLVNSLGIDVIDARLVDARPPHEVAPDFTAAQLARSESDRRRREASTRAIETTTDATSRAEALVVAARGASSRTVSQARASASRFEAIRSAMGEFRAQTMQRLYSDAMSEALPLLNRKLVLPGDVVDLSLYEENDSRTLTAPPQGPPQIEP